MEIKIGKGRGEAIFIFSNESIFCRISILFSFEEVIEILTDWQQAGFELVEELQDFVFFLQHTHNSFSRPGRFLGFGGGGGGAPPPPPENLKKRVAKAGKSSK
nr:hypothetical protein [uncultured Chryseobacterium sp.]